MTTTQSSVDTAEFSPQKRAYIRKVTLSSFIGNTMEYYDFLVYGTAAALVFPHVFFPESEAFIAQLFSLATFAVGFLARPLGGMFFGSRGDRNGRKSTLVMTLGIMGAATFAIGLIPSYATIGIWAPILLICLRLVQGFAVGGEWGGAMIIVLESAPAKKRGFYSAIPNTGGFSAQLLAAGVFALIGMLGQDALVGWAWRIPFLLSAAIIGVGIYIRSKLHESPVFEKTHAKAVAEAAASLPASTPTQQIEALAPTGSPLGRLFKEDWRTLLLIVGLRFAESVPYFLLTVFALSYATGHLNIPRNTMLACLFIASALAFPAHALYGRLSDRIGRKPVYLFGAIVGAIMAFPFMMLLNTGSFWAILIGFILVINIGHNAINAVQPAFFSELFPADRRYSGAASGREIASIVAGGLTPFIATALAGSDGTRWTWVATYVTAVCLITIVSVLVAPETFRRDLAAVGSTRNMADSAATR